MELLRKIFKKKTAQSSYEWRMWFGIKTNPKVIVDIDAAKKTIKEIQSYKWKPDLSRPKVIMRGLK